MTAVAQRARPARWFECLGCVPCDAWTPGLPDSGPCSLWECACAAELVVGDDAARVAVGPPDLPMAVPGAIVSL
jgi:hypothetical protein